MGWWGRLLFIQARKIAEYEQLLGMDLAMDHWHRTQRMLQGESGFFLGLLSLATTLVFVSHWRTQRWNRQVRAFFSAVTHELRTPLASVRLQAEAMQEVLGEATANDYRPLLGTLLERLLESAQHLGLRLARTLELARVEGGGGLNQQSLHLERWLASFIQSSPLPALRVNLRQLAEIQIQADVSALELIFENLLENAHRHGGPSVAVFIEALPLRAQQVGVRIWDEGPGFTGPVASLGQLFFKGPHSMGSGVGLYLVGALMRRMHGEARFLGGPGFPLELWFVRSSGGGA